MDSPSSPMEIFHTIDIILSLQMGVGQRAGALWSSHFHEFESSPVRDFELHQEIWDLGVLRLLLGDWPRISASRHVVRKIVLYIVWFAYSLFLLLLSLLLLVLLLVLEFPLLPY